MSRLAGEPLRREATAPAGGTPPADATGGRRRLPYELFLAMRYLRFQRGRTFLSLITFISVAGVMVGTAALVIALSLMAGFLEDVRERIHSGSAHLTVLSAEGDTFADSERFAARVAELPGVRAAAAVLHSPAMLMLPQVQTSGYAELFGVDPADHARVVLEPGAEVDPFAALARSTRSGRAGILLGATLAERIGAIEGDLVRVLVPELSLSPWSAVPRSQLFEVVGTYRSDHFQEDSRRAYATLAEVRRLLRAPGEASWLELRLDDLARLDPMKGSLRGELGAPWLVVDLIEQNEDLLKALRTEKLTLFLAIGLIVVVAALNIVSTLVLMVAGKVKEIGTLSAMGARPGGVATIFVLQGLIIGVVGTATGLALGTGVALWLDRSRFIELNPEVYYLTHIPFSPQATDLVYVGLASLVISLLATIYPAIRAAKLDPVEALRHE